jgi:hypothetical protein
MIFVLQIGKNDYEKPFRAQLKVVVPLRVPPGFDPTNQVSVLRATNPEISRSTRVPS